MIDHSYRNTDLTKTDKNSKVLNYLLAVFDFVFDCLNFVNHPFPLNKLQYSSFEEVDHSPGVGLGKGIPLSGSLDILDSLPCPSEVPYRPVLHQDFGEMHQLYFSIRHYLYYGCLNHNHVDEIFHQVILNEIETSFDYYCLEWGLRQVGKDHCGHHDPMYRAEEEILRVVLAHVSSIGGPDFCGTRRRTWCPKLWLPWRKYKL